MTISNLKNFEFSKMSKATYAVIVVVTAAGLTGWLWLNSAQMIGNVFSPDSYAVALLGRNLVAGNGYVTTGVRDNRAVAEWPVQSRSFPPMLPALTGLVDRVSDLELFSGVAVDFAALFFIMVLLLASFAHSWRSFGLLSLTVPFFYMMTIDFRLETTAGRTIPTALFFLTLAIFGIVRWFRTEKKRYAVLIGIALASLMLTRFDHFPFALATLGLMLIFRFKSAWPAAASFFLVALPWMINGIAHWGTPFPADSSITAQLLDPSATVMDFYPQGAEIPFMGGNPTLWLELRAGYFLKNFQTWVSLFQWPAYVLFALVLALIIYRRSWKELWPFAFASFYGLVQMVSIALTPYPDNRYFATTVFAFLLAAVLVLRKERIAIWVAPLILLFLIVKYTPGEARDLSPEKLYFEKTQNILQRLGFQPDDVIGVGDPKSWLPPEMFTYYTGDRTVFLPPNFPPGTTGFEEWKKKWNIKWFFLTEAFASQYKNELHIQNFTPIGSSHFIIIRAE